MGKGLVKNFKIKKIILGLNDFELKILHAPSDIC